MSRKKKKKKMQPAAPPKFAVGGHVCVKPGVADPDYPDMPLGGWSGTITEVMKRPSTTYLIRLDQRTLQNIHPVYRRRCERDGLEFESICLGGDDLLLDTGEPVPIEQPTRIVAKPLSPDDQHDRVRAALELTSDYPLPDVDETTLLKYHAHLAARLSFPFEADFSEETGPMDHATHPLAILGLLDPEEYPSDEFYGLICEAREGKHHAEVPLAELEVAEGKPDHQLISDYSYWSWNYR